MEMIYFCNSPDAVGSSSSALHHYLSSAVTEATGCGSSFSPWLLEAGEGQKINLTLYDYSYDSLSNYYKALQPNNSSSHRIPSMTCRILATVTENNSRNGALRICAGQGKVHSVFNSVSNQVQVRLLLPSTALQSSDSPQPNPLGFQFLFKIQGTQQMFHIQMKNSTTYIKFFKTRFSFFIQTRTFKKISSTCF